MWRFPKVRGTILGVQITCFVVYQGIYIGAPYFEKLPCNLKGVCIVKTQYLNQVSRFTERATGAVSSGRGLVSDSKRAMLYS